MVKKGLTPAEYKALLVKQGGRCAICKRQPGGGMGKRLAIDTDHSTKAVRGLLCHHCNLALGALGDSLPAIRRVVKYLERYHLRTALPTTQLGAIRGYLMEVATAA